MERLLIGDFLTNLAKYHFARLQLDHDRPSGIHTSDFFEIFWVVGGTGIHWLNGRSLPLRPGDLWPVSDTDAHSVFAEKGSVVRFINVAFPKEAWYRVRSRYFETDTDIFDSEHRTAFQLDLDDVAQFQSLAKILDDSVRDQCRLDMLLIAVGLLARRSYIRAAAPMIPEWLLGASKKLGEPECLRIGLPEFVRLAGRSSDHVAKMCAKHFGKTPTELINEARMQAAARLLTQTISPIELVGTAVGIPNTSYFYRLFARHFGCPPGDYRRRSQMIAGKLS